MAFEAAFCQQRHNLFAEKACSASGGAAPSFTAQQQVSRAKSNGSLELQKDTVTGGSIRKNAGGVPGGYGAPKDYPEGMLGTAVVSIIGRLG